MAETPVLLPPFVATGTSPWPRVPTRASRRAMLSPLMVTSSARATSLCATWAAGIHPSSSSPTRSASVFSLSLAPSRPSVLSLVSLPSSVSVSSQRTRHTRCCSSSNGILTASTSSTCVVSLVAALSKPSVPLFCSSVSCSPAPPPPSPCPLVSTP